MQEEPQQAQPEGSEMIVPVNVKVSMQLKIIRADGTIEYRDADAALTPEGQRLASEMYAAGATTEEVAARFFKGVVQAQPLTQEPRKEG